MSLPIAKPRLLVSFGATSGSDTLAGLGLPERRGEILRRLDIAGTHPVFAAVVFEHSVKVWV